MSTFDVIVIGSGPCGITCATELSLDAKHVALVESGCDYNERVCFVDQGCKCKNCSICKVMSGFGGCIHYGDAAKLSYYPSGKELYYKLGDSDYNDALKRALEKWKIGEKSFVEPTIKEENNLFEIKQYPVCVMNSTKVKDFIEELRKSIECDSNIRLFLNSSAETITKNDDNYEVALNSGESLYAPKVVIAVGRWGRTWLNERLDYLKIKYDEPIAVYGVRFEMPSKYLISLGKLHPDFKIRAKEKGKKYKTFCFNGGENGGRVKLLNYGADRFTLLDGHVLTKIEEGFGKGNFALLTQAIKPKGFTGTYQEYLLEIIERYKALNDISPGKPICQSYDDFYEKKQQLNREYDGESSIAELTYGNVFELFGEAEHAAFCKVCDSLFRYIYDHSGEKEIMYSEFLHEINVIGLEIEGMWNHIITNNEFETSSDGIYVGGDCTGESQGILQAIISGIAIADSIGGEH